MNEYLTKLKIQIDQIDLLKNAHRWGPEFKLWKSKTENILGKLFGHEGQKLFEGQATKTFSMIDQSFNDRQYQKELDNRKVILEGLLKDKVDSFSQSDDDETFTDMTNWTMKQKPDNELMSSFPTNEVRKYLGFFDGVPSGDPARWLLDAFQLSNTKWPNIYGDYSFIVVPASKALEYWIFKIAKDLSIDVNSDKAGVVRDQIESYLNTVLDKVEKKGGESIKAEVSFLKLLIQEYRNDIVHSAKRIDNATQAKNKVLVIFERINSITEKLVGAGLIKS